MASYHHDDDFFIIPEREAEAAEFISEVGRIYQDAFLLRKSQCKLTQQNIATALEVGRSHINRCLSGHSNMTLDTVAQLAWALKAKPRFSLDLEPLSEEDHGNYFHAHLQTVAPAAVQKSGNSVHIHPRDNYGPVYYAGPGVRRKPEVTNRPVNLAKEHENS